MEGSVNIVGQWQQQQRFFCFALLYFVLPRVLGSSLWPGAQDKLLNDRTSSPSLTTFSSGTQLGPWREQFPSSRTRRTFKGQSLVGGSKCLLKDIKVHFQNRDDSSLGAGSRYRDGVTIYDQGNFEQVNSSFWGSISSSVQMRKYADLVLLWRLIITVYWIYWNSKGSINTTQRESHRDRIRTWTTTPCEKDMENCQRAHKC